MANNKAPKLKLIDERDRCEYDLMRIGNQLWTAENFHHNVDGCSFMYKNRFSSLEKYGLLYSKDALDSVCPPGWHIPTLPDFEELYHFFEEKHESLTLVEKLSTKFTDENSGLQLGGYGSDCVDNFFMEGEGAYFWTSSKDSEGNPVFCSMDSQGFNYWNLEQLQDLFSIRLVCDDVFAIKPTRAILQGSSKPTLKEEDRVDGPF